MNTSVIYLDTYVLQQDMRIRLPKSILANIDAKKGISKFDIYYDPQSKNLILKLSNNSKEK